MKQQITTVIAAFACYFLLILYYVADTCGVWEIHNYSQMSIPWRKVEYGVPVPAEKTLERLKELKKLYQNQTGETAKLINDQLDQLLWLSEKELDKCTNYGKMRKYCALLETSNANIEAYVAYQWEKVRLFCQEQLDLGKITHYNWYDDRRMQWWKINNYMLFNTTVRLKPEDTLDFLKLVHAQLEYFVDDLAGFVTIRNEYNDLISISILSVNKCNEQQKNLIDRLYRMYSDPKSLKMNIFDYVSFWKNRTAYWCEYEKNRWMGPSSKITK